MRLFILKKTRRLSLAGGGAIISPELMIFLNVRLASNNGQTISKDLLAVNVTVWPFRMIHDP